MARGPDRERIFRDPRDRDDLVRRLATLTTAGARSVYAWALLPNHFHLLVRTGARPLARTMWSLLTGYAEAFNRRRRRTGHLFQNRCKSVVVEEEPYFLELVRYLHLNPLRTGVVPDVRGLDRYRYSGHAPLLGTASYRWQDIGTALGRFGGNPRRARAKYQAFVVEGAGQGRRPELMGGGWSGALGSGRSSENSGVVGKATRPMNEYLKAPTSSEDSSGRSRGRRRVELWHAARGPIWRRCPDVFRRQPG